MTDREKLVELIQEVAEEIMVCGEDWYYTVNSDTLADHLIANGVTVQGWASAKEPPQEWKDADGTLINYLVYMPEFGVDVGNYLKDANAWLCMGLPCKVTHWMPLPEPPKED